MEQIRAFFGQFFGQLNAGWSQLTTMKKAGIVAGIVVLVAILAAVVAGSRSESYEYLFVNLSAEDAHSITDYLKKNNLNNFIMDDKGVKVPSKDVVPYRLKLTQEGLPANGQVGWEKFDDADFTRTEFERNIHKIRAIQGELSRTITSIDGISAARVHIVTPQQRLFEKDQKEATAAIYIKAKRGAVISERQIRGIVHLVSKSVEGLNPENISIIDYEGKLLTEERSKDASTRESKEMTEFKRNFEKRLEENVRGIVGRVVGQDRVEARIEADFDFTKEEQTISDLDPDKVVVISSNTTAQDVDGAGLNPTGIPGSKSNVPGEQEALNLTTSQMKNKRNTELTNYEVAKTISHKVLPVGKLKRISAAVIVDGKQTYPIDGTKPAFEARNEEEMRKIEELVRSAIGFVESRDEVKVHNLLFQPDYIQVEAINAQKQESREYVSALSVSAAVALALVLFFTFIVRPYFRWLSYDPQRKRDQSTIEEFRPDIELGEVQSVQVKEDVPFDKLTPQEQVMYIAKHEPQRTTEAIRMLLNPHSGQ